LKDDEITGFTGTDYTATFWEYDARLGRRWSVDPVVKHSESPYATFAGNPIWYNDPNGDDPGGDGDKKNSDCAKCKAPTNGTEKNERLEIIRKPHDKLVAKKKEEKVSDRFHAEWNKKPIKLESKYAYKGATIDVVVSGNNAAVGGTGKFLTIFEGSVSQNTIVVQGHSQ